MIFAIALLVHNVYEIILWLVEKLGILLTQTF